MEQRKDRIITNEEENLTIKYLSNEEMQMLERFDKLTDNFRKAILGIMEVCIEYQDKHY